MRRSGTERIAWVSSSCGNSPGTIPFAIGIPLVIAALLNEHVRGWRFFRSVYFLPTAVSWVVIGMVALQFFALNGMLNQLLRDVGLGSVQTNAKGQFEISYTETQFRDFNETQPDLYLKVFDASGKKLLLSTKKQVRRSAEVLERYEIKIPRAKLA